MSGPHAQPCGSCVGVKYYESGIRQLHDPIDTCTCDEQETTMFDRFTDRARQVMGFARKEATVFGHDYIGTEHILLGMIEEGKGVAARVLQRLNISRIDVQVEVRKLGRDGPTMTTMGQLPFTPLTKSVLELSLAEANELRHNYIGTEHLLLGLLREEEGTAAKVLTELGVSLPETRHEILVLLGATDAGSGFDRYQAFTRSTAIYPHRNEPCFESASYCTFGLTGEAGEIAEKMKKRFRLGGSEAFKPGSTVTYKKTGKSETYEEFVAAVKKELGDVLWYVAGLSSELGIKLSDVAETNVEKLSSRKRRGVLMGKGDDR